MTNISKNSFRSLFAAALSLGAALTGCGGGSNNSSPAYVYQPAALSFTSKAIRTSAVPALGVTNSLVIEKGNPVLVTLSGSTATTLNISPTAISPDGLTVAGLTPSGRLASVYLPNFTQTTLTNTGYTALAVSNKGLIFASDAGGKPFLIQGPTVTPLPQNISLNGWFDSSENLFVNQAGSIVRYTGAGVSTPAVNGTGQTMLGMKAPFLLEQNGATASAGSLGQNSVINETPVLDANGTPFSCNLTATSNDGLLLGGGAALTGSSVSSAPVLLLRKASYINFNRVDLTAPLTTAAPGFQFAKVISIDRTPSAYYIQVMGTDAGGSSAYVILEAKFAQ